MSKCDAELGKNVRQYLIEQGVESPINYEVYDGTTSEQKIQKLNVLMKDALEVMGFDQTNDSVKDTGKRIATMWVNETMRGLDYKNFPKVMTFENKFKSSEMVIERNVQSMSLCSHHIVTIDGVAHVAYIPKSKIIGLSKINRVVDYFSRRPQEAERLTLQIFYALEYILETSDIAVFLTGTHYCVKSRGVGDINSSTSTVKLGGSFMSDPMVRKEFYDVVHSQK